MKTETIDILNCLDTAVGVQYTAVGDVVATYSLGGRALLSCTLALNCIIDATDNGDWVVKVYAVPDSGPTFLLGTLNTAGGADALINLPDTTLITAGVPGVPYPIAVGSLKFIIDGTSGTPGEYISYSTLLLSAIYAD